MSQRTDNRCSQQKAQADQKQQESDGAIDFAPPASHSPYTDGAGVFAAAFMALNSLHMATIA